MGLIPAQRISGASGHLGFQRSTAPAGSGWGPGVPEDNSPSWPLGGRHRTSWGTALAVASKAVLQAPAAEHELPPGLVLWGLRVSRQCLGEVGLRRSHQSLGS